MYYLIQINIPVQQPVVLVSITRPMRKFRRPVSLARNNVTRASLATRQPTAKCGITVTLTVARHRFSVPMELFLVR